MDAATSEKYTQLKSQLDDANSNKRQIAVKKLLSLNVPEVLDLLLSKVDDIDADVRMYIATGMGQFIEFKEKIFPALQKFFKDPDRHVKLSAVKSAIELKDPKLIPNLLQMVKHTNKEIRIASLEGLMEFKAKDMFPLVETFLLDTDVKVRATTIKAFAISPEKITLDKFLPLIEDDNGEVRANAAAILGNSHLQGVDQAIYTQFVREEQDFVKMAQIEALGKLKFVKALNDIKKYLTDEHETELRMAAAYALGELGDKSVIEELMNCANDEETDLRMNAIEALGKIADPGSIPALEQLKDDEDEEIQEAAVCALEKIHAKIEADKVKTIPIPSLSQTSPQLLNQNIEKSSQLGGPAPDSLKTTTANISPVNTQESLIKLIANLSSPDNITRVKASRLLAAWQPIPFELYVKSLNSEDAMQRAYMAETLGLIGDKRAITPLRNLLQDIDTTVQALVQWALMRCGDAEFRESPSERKHDHSHDHVGPRSHGKPQYNRSRDHHRDYSRESDHSSTGDHYGQKRPYHRDDHRSGKPHSRPYRPRDYPPR